MAALKKIPHLTSDKQAEDWLMSADLSEYDLSGGVPAKQFWAQVEAQRKSKAISLRLPVPMLDAVQAVAAQTRTPTQRLIRQAVSEWLARRAKRKSAP